MEPSQELPRKLDHSQFQLDSLLQDVTRPEISSSESLTQSHPLKDSTEELELWLLTDSLLLTTKKDLSLIKLEAKSISNCKPLTEKVHTPGLTLTFLTDWLDKPTDTSTESSPMKDTTHSAAQLMMLKEKWPTLTIPSTFNPNTQLVHIFLFSF